MKKLVFVSLFCIAACINSYSQTKQESVKELFHLMQQDSMIDKTFSNIMSTMSKNMQSRMKDSTSIARSRELFNSMMQSVKDITKKMIDEDMVLMYDKYFTEDEIKDFIAFYKSPSGQKMIHVMPDIQKEMMAVMFQKYMPEIQKAVKAKAEEMKAAEKTKTQEPQ